MITLKLKTNLIDKARIFRGKKHNYLDLVLIENRNGTDEFGNDGIVKQSVTAQERADGIEMPIIGNWSHVRTKSAPRSESAPSPAPSRASAGNLAEEDYQF
jgi:2,3-bisphosphoglycerate-independent phosphoglycerate mutase